MKYLSFGVVLLASAAGIAAQAPANKANDAAAKDPITLTGCVEAGTAPNTFVLTHVVRGDSSTSAASPMPQPSVTNPTATPPIVTPPVTPPNEEPKPTAAPPTTEPAPTATSGTESNANAAIYWLDPPDKLKAHVGHKVSISGTIDDDMDKTKVKDKGDKVKIEAERGSRTVEAKQGTAGAAEAKAVAGSAKQESYKVKVKSVTMISSSCS
jgi:hypothetical protein